MKNNDDKVPISTQVTTSIIQESFISDENSFLDFGDVCEIELRLLFNKDLLKTEFHSSDALIGIPNLRKDIPSKNVIKLGYYNSQISKLLHESIQKIKIGQLAHISFELDPELLLEGNQPTKCSNQSGKVYFDVKFEAKVLRKIESKELIIEKLETKDLLSIENTTLTLTECFQINESSIYTLNEFEAFQLSELHKRDANELFKKKLFQTAFRRYHKSISLLIISHEQVNILDGFCKLFKKIVIFLNTKANFNLRLAKEDKKILPDNYQEFIDKLSLTKTQLYCNLAACQLRCSRFKLAIVNCNKCLEQDKTNPKALFRRSKAYAELNEYELAKNDLRTLGELAPGDRDVERQMAHVNKLEREYIASQKTYAKNIQKMFS